MERSEFQKYNDLPCRFRLKGGKEIFGVIWENRFGDQLKHYFSTAADRMRYKTAEKSNDKMACNRLMTPVELRDIVLAEPLQNS